MGGCYHGEYAHITEQSSIGFWSEIKPLQVDHSEHGVEYPGWHSHCSLEHHYEEYRGDLEEGENG